MHAKPQLRDTMRRLPLLLILFAGAVSGPGVAGSVVAPDAREPQALATSSLVQDASQLSYASDYAVAW